MYLLSHINAQLTKPETPLKVLFFLCQERFPLTSEGFWRPPLLTVYLVRRFLDDKE